MKAARPVVTGQSGLLVTAAPLSARCGGWRDRRIAGTPLEPVSPTRRGNTAGGRGNYLGYGKSTQDWAIRSQAPKGRAIGLGRRFRD